MSKSSDQEIIVDEVTFNYSIENHEPREPEFGRTHILVVDYPESCDEECFLISLKAYLRARSESLRMMYDKSLPN